MRAVRNLGWAVAITAMLAPGARAQGSNEYLKLTYLTFSAPVQVPGVTLPAGTYRFQMADILTGSAHAVQVFSQDGKQIYTTFLAVPAEMRDTPDKTVVMFAERPAGAPQAVKEWFYPGNSIGEEFVYPKSMAVKIAKANHTTVPAIEDESAKNASALKGAKIGRVDENGNISSSEQHETARNEAPAATAPANTNPTSQSTATTVGTSGQTGSETASQPAQSARNTRRQLPRTASSLPLDGLLSLLALGAGLAVGQLRRRLA